MTRDTKPADTEDQVAAALRKSFQPAIDAAALDVRVREWIARQRKGKMSAADMLKWADSLEYQKSYGPAFAAAVRKKLGPATKRQRVQRVITESKRQLGKDLKAEGVRLVVIPDKDMRISEVVAELVRRIDAGKRPSARAAAALPSLDASQARKLATSPVKRSAAAAGICLMPDSPFVARLRQRAGLLGMVIAPHKDLAAVARVLGGALRTMNEEDQRTAAPGAWHDRAATLWEADHTVNEIARMLNQKPDTVKKALARRGLLGGSRA